MPGPHVLSTLIFVSHRMTWGDASGTEVSLLRQVSAHADCTGATGVMFVGDDTIMGVLECPDDQVSDTDQMLRGLAEHKVAWSQRLSCGGRSISRQLPVGLVFEDELPAGRRDLAHDPARFRQGGGHLACEIASVLRQAAAEKYPSYILDPHIALSSCLSSGALRLRAR